MTEIILLIFFTLVLIHYMFFLASVYNGLGRIKNKASENSYFFSVIIPFRNEEENLLSNLNSIESQTFDKNRFEVIYVDDNSTDNSYQILCGRKKSANIKVIKVPAGQAEYSHKKNALNSGIKNSSGEIIITTDADCVFDKNWLNTLASAFDEKTGFVSAPVVFKEPNSFFEKIQKLEFAGLVLTGAGLIGSNRPKICNAANIAYKRDAFLNAGGFTNHKNLSSGDDELLMQKIHKSKKYRIKFLLEKEAVVETKPNKKLADFFQQRRRWGSKTIFYEDKIFISRLIFIFFFYAGLIVQLLLALLLSPLFLISFAVSIISKFLLEFLILKKGEGVILSKKDLEVFFPAQAFQIFYIISASILGLFGNYTWKARRIKR